MQTHRKVKEQIKEAMRARDSIRLDTLRGLNALFMNEMLSGKSDGEYISDEKAERLVKKSINQRKDSIEQFQKGGRNDLAEKELAELKILESLVPLLMTREEIRPIVEKRIQEMKTKGQFDPKAVGKLIGIIIKEFAGKADGAEIKAIIEEFLK